MRVWGDPKRLNAGLAFRSGGRETDPGSHAFLNRERENKEKERGRAGGRERQTPDHLTPLLTKHTHTCKHTRSHALHTLARSHASPLIRQSQSIAVRIRTCARGLDDCLNHCCLFDCLKQCPVEGLRQQRDGAPGHGRGQRPSVLAS